MTISAISFISGISVIAGGPVGVLVSMGLNLIATALTIYQKKTEKPESDKVKMEKVIVKALKDYRESGLKSDWHVYQRMSDLFASHVELLQNFGKKDLSAIREDVKDTGLNIDDQASADQLKLDLFETVLSQMGDVIRMSTNLLGRIEYEITQECDMDIPLKKVKEKWWKKESETPRVDDEEDEGFEEIAKKCLGLYELYSEINSYRGQTFLGHILTFKAIMKNEQGNDKNEKDDQQKGQQNGKQDSAQQSGQKTNSESEEYKRKTFILSELIFNMFNEMTEHNKELYQPFVNPFLYYKLRYVVNYYHTYSTKYKHLKAYLDTLKLEKSSTKNVMACRRSSLLGSCTNIQDFSVEFNKNNKCNFKSVFVPRGLVLDVHYDSNFKPIHVIGPSILGSLFYDRLAGTATCPVTQLSTSTVAQKKEGEDEKSRLKMCRAPNTYGKDDGKAAPSLKIHKAICTTQEIDGFTREGKTEKVGQVFNIKDIKDELGWKNKYMSFQSEDKDVAFIAYATLKLRKKIFKTKGELKSKEEATKEDTKNPLKTVTVTLRWGPFFSPRKMSYGCGSILWDSIKVYKYNNAEYKTPQGNPKPEVLQEIDENLCKGSEQNENLLCQKDHIDPSYFVTICKQPELKGYCEDIPAIKDKVVDLTRINVYMESEGKDISGKDLSKYEVDDVKRFFDDTLDDCIWIPRREIGVNGKVAENLLQSMKIPEGIVVELYTERSATGMMFGPYVGPMTVDKVDGNTSMGTIIRSIKIMFDFGVIWQKKDPKEESSSKTKKPIAYNLKNLKETIV